MVIEVSYKKEEDKKKESELTNGIYAIWFLGFTNGLTFILTGLLLLNKHYVYAVAMFLLWFLTLPPKKDKFVSVFTEKNRK